MSLPAEEMRRLHAWRRAANYLSVGQIYLLDNALLKQPLSLQHIKPGSGIHRRGRQQEGERGARRPASRCQHSVVRGASVSGEPQPGERHRCRQVQVRGYKEEGTTTRPFDRAVRNDLDRFHLVMDIIDRVPGVAGAYERAVAMNLPVAIDSHQHPLDRTPPHAH